MSKDNIIDSALDVVSIAAKMNVLTHDHSSKIVDHEIVKRHLRHLPDELLFR